jgi:hypothetical protein
MNSNRDPNYDIHLSRGKVKIIVAIIGLIGMLGAALINVNFYNWNKSTNPNKQQDMEEISTTESIAGSWTGTIKGIEIDFSAEILLYINKGCTINEVCGTYSVPSIPCSGNLILNQIDNNTFVFEEQKTGGVESCSLTGIEYLKLLPDQTLSWEYGNQGESILSNGILTK